MTLTFIGNYFGDKTAIITRACVCVCVFLSLRWNNRICRRASVERISPTGWELKGSQADSIIFALIRDDATETEKSSRFKNNETFESLRRRRSWPRVQRLIEET